MSSDDHQHPGQISLGGGSVGAFSLKGSNEGDLGEVGGRKTRRAAAAAAAVSTSQELPIERDELMMGSDDDSDDGGGGKKKEKKGRRKIKIEFIEDKSRRHITFSKRKAGIMKKAFELATLTGTQVLLLVASETGHVYTFATPKLQPLITKPEGKNLIQQCLNSTEVTQIPVQQPQANARMNYSGENQSQSSGAFPDGDSYPPEEEKKPRAKATARVKAEPKREPAQQAPPPLPVSQAAPPSLESLPLAGQNGQAPMVPGQHGGMPPGMYMPPFYNPGAPGMPSLGRGPVASPYGYPQFPQFAQQYGGMPFQGKPPGAPGGPQGQFMPHLMPPGLGMPLMDGMLPTGPLTLSDHPDDVSGHGGAHHPGMLPPQMGGPHPADVHHSNGDDHMSHH